MNTLPADFFQQDPVTCARALVGCLVISGKCSGRIVETEAYSAENDDACHTATRPSARAFIAAHPPGTAYVYLNYGMHWMLNALVKSSAAPHGFVLIRALEPLQGIPLMTRRRKATRKTTPPKNDTRWLCSGPGRLAAALAIRQSHHGADLCNPDSPLRFAPRPASSPAPGILASPRIGITRATDLPWRFTEKDSRFLSVPVREK